MKDKKLKYKLNESEKLDGLAPQLSKLNKANPFKVPDNYFEKLPLEILFRINNPEKASTRKNLFLTFQHPKYSFAAAVTVILIVGSILLFHKPASIPYTGLTEFTLDDILLENPDLIETMDETLLLETLASGSGDELINYLDSTSVFNHAITDDQFIEYLSEENLTPDLLYDL
jgi:hypothetical protein